MTAVVSLHANPERPAAAAAVIDAVSGRLRVAPNPGADGSWEFSFGLSYSQAHAAVAQALADADPEWPGKVTLDYALAI